MCQELPMQIENLLLLFRFVNKVYLRINIEGEPTPF